MTREDKTNRINLYSGDYVLMTVVVVTVVVSNKVLRTLGIIPSVGEFSDSNMLQAIVLGFIYIAILVAIVSILAQVLSVSNNKTEQLILDSKEPNAILGIVSDGRGRTFDEIESLLTNSVKENLLGQKIKLNKLLAALVVLKLLRCQEITFKSKKEKITDYFFFITDKGRALLEKQQLEKQKDVSLCK